jgi:hypothetical protein
MGDELSVPERAIAHSRRDLSALLRFYADTS